MAHRLCAVLRRGERPRHTWQRPRPADADDHRSVVARAGGIDPGAPAPPSGAPLEDRRTELAESTPPTDPGAVRKDQRPRRSESIHSPLARSRAAPLAEDGANPGQSTPTTARPLGRPVSPQRTVGQGGFRTPASRRRSRFRGDKEQLAASVWRTRAGILMRRACQDPPLRPPYTRLLQTPLVLLQGRPAAALRPCSSPLSCSRELACVLPPRPAGRQALARIYTRLNAVVFAAGVAGDA